MGKFIKSGRVVICLQGRQAGKKAVVVKTFDEGSKARPFPHALCVGVQRAPLKITKSMGKKKQQKRLRCKPFFKYVNYTHMMPTRYSVPSEMEAKGLVSESQMESKDALVEAKKQVSAIFKEKFANPAAAGSKSGDKAAIQFLKKKLRF